MSRLINNLLSSIAPDESRYVTPNIAASCMIRLFNNPDCYSAWLGVSTTPILMRNLLLAARDARLKIAQADAWLKLASTASKINAARMGTGTEYSAEQKQTLIALSNALYQIYQTIPAKLASHAEAVTQSDIRSTYASELANMPAAIREAGISILRGQPIKTALAQRQPGSSEESMRSRLMIYIRRLTGYRYVFRDASWPTLAAVKGHADMLKAALHLEEILAQSKKRLAA